MSMYLLFSWGFKALHEFTAISHFAKSAFLSRSIATYEFRLSYDSCSDLHKTTKNNNFITLVLQQGILQYACSFIWIDLHRIFQVSKTCTILSTDFKIMTQWFKLHQKSTNTQFHWTQSSKQAIQHNDLLPPEVLMEKLQNVPVVSAHLCSRIVASDKGEDAELPQTEVLVQQLQSILQKF